MEKLDGRLLILIIIDMIRIMEMVVIKAGITITIHRAITEMEAMEMEMGTIITIVAVAIIIMDTRIIIMVIIEVVMVSEKLILRGLEYSFADLFGR